MCMALVFLVTQRFMQHIVAPLRVRAEAKSMGRRTKNTTSMLTISRLRNSVCFIFLGGGPDFCG